MTELAVAVEDGKLLTVAEDPVLGFVEVELRVVENEVSVVEVEVSETAELKPVPLGTVNVELEVDKEKE